MPAAIGAAIGAVGGLASGYLGGKSARDAARKQRKRVKKYYGEAQDTFQQYSPEMLDIYRGIIPELQGIWSNQKEMIGDIYRGRYQEAADASKQRSANTQQQLQRRGLGSTTAGDAFNRAQAAEDQRTAMAIDAAKAGQYGQWKAAEAASKLQGRGMAAGGIGNVATQDASYPAAIASFFAGGGGANPVFQPDGQSLGMLGGALGDIFGNINFGGGSTQADPFTSVGAGYAVAPATSQFMGNIGMQAMKGMFGG